MTDRLDRAMVERGLARSRTQAARLIAEGVVSVDGGDVRKAATRVEETQRIDVASADHYVSRAAHKLVAALDAFGLDVHGRHALDVGASTGGFSQVLLERGAGEVIALDVGHGQLAPSLAGEARIRSFEGINVRYLSAERLGKLTASPRRPDLVVGDLSFISLRQVMDALVATAADGADFVLLIKPQFEVGKQSIDEGIVRTPRLRAQAVEGVLAAAGAAGLGVAGLAPSPILGTNGNHEYLVHLTSRAGRDPSEWSRQLTRMVQA